MKKSILALLLCVLLLLSSCQPATPPVVDNTDPSVSHTDQGSVEPSETPPAQDDPAHSETPPAQESPAPSETPPAQENPAPSETPPAQESPAPSETPPAQESPAPSETPPAQDDPAPSETPPVQESPAPSETPPAQDDPAPSETPPAQESPAPSETPPVQDDPAPDTPSAAPEQNDSCASHTDGDDNGLCDVCSVSVLVVVDFFGINDMHGKLPDGDNHPGADELTTYLKNERQANDHTVLLSVGDMWQGTSESNLTEGNMITDWMNELDFAAMAMGNHEFDWGEDAVRGNDAIAEFPFLAINIYERKSNKQVEYCQSSVMVECGDVQIGIIGAIGDCYSSISAEQTTNIYFKTGSELTALVKSESEKLRSEGADFIVYVLHDGLGQSASGTVTSSKLKSYYDVALSDGYVDIVFEGHTHQRYVFKDAEGVYHIQGGGDNKGITHAEVQINSANGNCSINMAETITTSTYSMLEDDPLIEELMQKYAEEISPASRVLGSNSRRRYSDDIRKLVADLYYQAGVERWGDRYDIVLGGGLISVRAPYSLMAGEVTYGDLQDLLPFDNDLVLCSVSGKNLKSKFFESTHDSYAVGYGDYGASVRNSINPNATYYIVVDTYTSTYKPNGLTEIARYTPGVYARDLLADYIAAGGLN